MSRFIPENSLTEEQLKEQEWKEKQEIWKHKYQEEQNERKSLYEQLQENKAREEAEFQNMVNQRNSSHKLSQKDVEHYTKLKERELAAERKQKLEIAKGLAEYNRKTRELEQRTPNINVIVPKKLTIKRKAVSRQEDLTKKKKVPSLFANTQIIPTPSPPLTAATTTKSKQKTTQLVGLGDYASSDEE